MAFEDVTDEGLVLDQDVTDEGLVLVRPVKPQKPQSPYKVGQTIRKKGLSYKITRIDKGNVYGDLVPTPEKSIPVKTRQAFKPTLPLSIPERIQESKFKFETSPFRETPEQFLLRSDAPTDPQQRLRRERVLAARAGKTLDVARPETQKEREETLRIQRNQELSDKYGPGAFNVAKIIHKAGTTLSEPLVGSTQEFIGLSGDIQAAATGDFEELKRRQAARDASMARYTESLGKGVIGEGYDPLHLGDVISYVAPLALPIKGAAKRPIIGTEPFRGGARVGVRPPIRPTPPTPPRKLLGTGESSYPKLLRPSEELPVPPERQIDLYDKHLSGGNIVPYQGGISVTSPLSETVPSVPRGWARAGARPDQSQDISFELVPSSRPGEAPVLVVPDWVLHTLQGRPIGGVNLDFQLIPDLHMKIRSQAPSPKHAQAAINSLVDIHKAASDQGLETISLIGKTQAEGETSKPIYMGHETFHAGQAKVGSERLGYTTTHIHDPEWALQDPDVVAIATAKGMDPQVVAMELPTYVIAQHWNHFFDDISQGTDSLYRYLDHIAGLYGSDALQTLGEVAKLSPEGMEILKSARSTYESRELNRIASLVSPGAYESRGPQDSTIRSVSEVEGGGLDRRTDQEGAGGIDVGITTGAQSFSEPPPGRDPVEWYHSQLEKVVQEKFPNKMTSDQAMAMLTPYGSKYGMKLEEYERSGLDELIAQKAVRGEQVTKAELLDVIRSNKIVIEEKVYGEKDEAKFEQLGTQLNEIAERRFAIVRELDLLEGRRDDLAEQLAINAGERWSYLEDYGKSVYRQKAEDQNLFLRQDLDRYRDKLYEINEEQDTVQIQYRQAQTSVVPHTSWKALKGGIPGTDREIVLTLPPPKLELPLGTQLVTSGQYITALQQEGDFPRTIGARGYEYAVVEEGKIVGSGSSEQEAIENAHAFITGRRTSKDIFTTSHYPGVENPVVHFRMDEGHDSEGQRVLRVQEVQSDWHQKGREEGYDDENRRLQIEKIQKEITDLDRRVYELAQKHEEIDGSPLYEQIRKLDFKLGYTQLTTQEFMQIEDQKTELGRQYENLVGPIEDEIDRLNEERRSLSLKLSEMGKADPAPDAPFKQTWPDLAFKRIIRWAADKGFKKIVWPTGAQQIDLYESELRKNVDRIEFKSHGKAMESHARPEAKALLNKINDLQVDLRILQDRREELWNSGDSRAWREVSLDQNEVENQIYDLKIQYGAEYGSLKFDSLTEIYMPAETHGRGIGTIRAFKEGAQVLDTDVKDEKWLKEHVGDKIFKTLMETGVAEGKDLSIGGQLHKFLYDTRLPNIAKEYGKKFGGQYKPSQLSIARANYRVEEVEIDGETKYKVIDPIDRHTYFTTEKAALDFAEAQANSPENYATAHSFTISPKLSEKARYEGFALSEVEPPIKEGDLVKSKSRGLEGKVTKLGSDEDGPWAEVTFKDNKTEELYLNDLTKVTKGVTKSTSAPTTTPGEAGEGKIVPSLPGPMKIRGSSLQVDKIGPGDQPGKVRVQFQDGTITQFDLNDVRDKRGRRIKDPILYMIVKDPPIIGAPSGPAKIPPAPPPPPGREGPLYVPVVSNLTTKALAEKFTELLFSGSIEMNTRPISEQVYLAMLAGKVQPDAVYQILDEENIPPDEFAQDALFSVSEGARTMAHYSHIVRRHWLRLIQENPGLIQKAIPPAKQIELMLDEMKKSILGMNWWRRLGRDTQKSLLTQYSTAVVNYVSATGRIPADAASAVVGSMLQGMMEGTGTWQERLEKAREGAEATLQAHVEVVRAFNPRQFLEWLDTGQAGTEYAEHEKVITLLEKYFPDIHSKLFARTYGEEAQALAKIEDYLPAAKLLLPRVKNEALRRQLDEDIEKYSKKLKIEKSNIMWIVKGPEWILDQVLRPANFGEFLLRRPRFIGRLGLELMDRGMDLGRMVEIEMGGPAAIAEAMENKEETFRDIPEDAFKAALSDALEFTMNYDPRTDKDAPYIERYIGVPFIKMMNGLGIVSLKFTAFPRAMFSALKTMYEYTPLLVFAGARRNSPLRKVFWRGKRKDPKTGEEYNPNPPGRGDYERIGKAFIGTFFLYLAWKLIDEGILDEDGKKLKTPLKGPDKRPVYEDVSRYKPIATHFRIAALLDRMSKGTMGDRNAANEIYEIITGMTRYEGDQDPVEILDATLEFMGGESDTFHKWNMAKRELGEIFPAPFLTPLLNLRSVIATVDKDENLKKDLKGQGFWGPSIDKIAILRRGLPNLTYPLEPGPARLSLEPAMAGLAGIQLQPGQNAVGEEFKRLGINVRNYLRSDPDPIINREQNRIFESLTRVLGGLKISSPEYQAASNVGKAAMLEELLIGDDGIASYAHEQALLANPMEADRKKLKGEVPGKYTRKLTGVERMLELMPRK